MMTALGRRLRKLDEIQAEQEEEEGPSIAEILRAGRWPPRAGGEVSPSKTVACAQPRTLAEIVRYRRQQRLAREGGADLGQRAEQA
jgi:hypothetical protein